MPALTKDEALQIGDSFAELARAVENYRFDHAGELDDTGKSDFQDAEHALRSRSDSFYDTALNLAMDDAQSALDQLAEVTKHVKVELKTLRNIQKALGVVATLVELGKAVATGNPFSIGAAVKSTFEAVSQAKAG
jgi:hypothetical protein